VDTDINEINKIKFHEGVHEESRKASFEEDNEHLEEPSMLQNGVAQSVEINEIQSHK